MINEKAPSVDCGTQREPFVMLFCAYKFTKENKMVYNHLNYGSLYQTD